MWRSAQPAKVVSEEKFTQRQLRQRSPRTCRSSPEIGRLSLARWCAFSRCALQKQGHDNARADSAQFGEAIFVKSNKGTTFVDAGGHCRSLSRTQEHALFVPIKTDDQFRTCQAIHRVRDRAHLAAYGSHKPVEANAPYSERGLVFAPDSRREAEGKAKAETFSRTLMPTPTPRRCASTSSDIPGECR